MRRKNGVPGWNHSYWDKRIFDLRKESLKLYISGETHQMAATISKFIIDVSSVAGAVISTFLPLEFLRWYVLVLFLVVLTSDGLERLFAMHDTARDRIQVAKELRCLATEIRSTIHQPYGSAVLEEELKRSVLMRYATITNKPVVMDTILNSDANSSETQVDIVIIPDTLAPKLASILDSSEDSDSDQ
jgi:hypothetical protein